MHRSLKERSWRLLGIFLGSWDPGRNPWRTHWCLVAQTEATAAERTARAEAEAIAEVLEAEAEAESLTAAELLKQKMKQKRGP